jgi:glycosyltransferase involved in cell wall biosynthesis
MPRVSVIVPAYNYAHLLSQTLESVLAQTLRDWECIVVDDGSTDNTRKVVENFCKRDERIRYVHQENAGLSAARNTGIRNSRGEFLQFLDADDLIEPEKLRAQANYLNQHCKVDIVYGEVRYFHSERPDERSLSMDGGEYSWTVQVNGAGEEVLRALLRDNITVVHAPLLRASIVQDVGFFDETLKSKEDWDFWLRCALSGKHFAYHAHENTLALVRSHSGSMSQNRQRMWTTGLQVRYKLMEVLPPSLKQVNNNFARHERMMLQLEQALDTPNFIQRMTKISRAGLQRRNAKWMLYALAFPIIKSPRWRPLLQNIRWAVARLMQRLKTGGSR